jgi:hypothetical protein
MFFCRIGVFSTWFSDGNALALKVVLGLPKPGRRRE